MGMSFGMIGAIGGAGVAAGKEADFLYKEDEKAADDTRQRSLQDWLMSKREQYQIASEGRAETRQIAQEDRGEQRTVRTEDRASTRRETEKDKDFQRTQDEAPVRRKIKAEDTTSDITTKVDAAYSVKDKAAELAASDAQAKETPSTKALHEAQADYYSGRNEAAANNGAAKLDPADSAELKAVQANLKEKQTLIDRGRADGSWNDEALTPGQKKLQADLVAMRKREQAIIAANRRTASAATPDPLNLRGGSGGATTRIASKPGDADQAAILQAEFRKASARAQSATDPDEKQRAELDRDSVAMEMKRLGIQPSAAPAGSMIGGGPAPVPAAAPAAPGKTAPAAAAPAGSARAQLEALTGGSAPAGSTGNTPAAGGSDRKAAVEKLKAKAAGSTSAPAAAPAADPLLTAMGAEGGSAIAQMQAAKAPQLRAAADAIRAAQAEVVQAGKSGQQAAVQAAMAKVQAASNALNMLLKDMNPPQAEAIKRALGVV
jgi:hypothetical protein